MSRKTVSFAQLLAYFRRGAGEESEPVLHNLLGDSEDDIEQEFRANARHIRQPGRVILFHEVISLATADRSQVRPGVLEDLARFYLDRRAPDALAFGRVHMRSNPHVHLLISGNRVASSRQNRLSRKEFGELKRELEEYQRARYPELLHSFVQSPTPAADRMKRRRAEEERARRLRRTGQPEEASRKEEIALFLREAARAASSAAEWHEFLKSRGLRAYHRGRHRGIEELQTGRRYRFATLGVGAAYSDAAQRWARVADRVEDLQRLEAERLRLVAQRYQER